MKPDHTRVKIGQATVTVPVVDDLDVTASIARQVTEKLQEIEGASDRIDTHAFALQAAFHFAAEVHRLHEEQESDTKSLLKALDELHTQLQAVISGRSTNS